MYPDLIVTGLATNLQQLCHSYAQGKPLDVPLSMLDDADYAELLRRLVAVRKKHPVFFLNGRFIDSRGLTTTGDLRVFGIEERGGDGLLVNVWLPGTEPGVPVETALRIDRPSLRPQCVYPDDLLVADEGGWLTLRWRGPVATLIV